MKVWGMKRLKPSKPNCKRLSTATNVKSASLCSKAERLKLKKIGGIPDKQWNMWFNTTIPVKSYQWFLY